MTRIAVALDETGAISAHFGHSASFAMFEANGKSLKGQSLAQPGEGGACACEGGGILVLLKGANNLLCGGMGPGAVEKLRSAGIEPVIVDPALAPEEAVKLFLSGSLAPLEFPSCGCGGHGHGHGAR
jgi:predicted Fe-Mo cluster-binding NifX family protein